MITLIEALNYRCLKYVHQNLGSFHVLVGANATGKTTFLDVIAFLGDVVSDGPVAAVERRTGNIQDLLWRRKGDRFELAIEARFPPELSERLADKELDTVRYEVAIGLNPAVNELGLLAEKVVLKRADDSERQVRLQFPMTVDAPGTILTPKQSGRSRRLRPVINKVFGGNDNFYSETYSTRGKGWVPAVRYGHRRSALGNLPAEEEKFPVSFWLRDLLAQGVQSIALNSTSLRQASAPGQGRKFKPDGSNLPWVIANLSKKDNDRFREWIGHLQTALPDLEHIRTVERPEDRHRYLMLRYKGGLTVPSWLVSDGTLRLLALTLPAYLPDLRGVFLIEEPENGIHPKAVDTMFQSLSSVYDAQVLLATHSPVVLGIVEAGQVLCFAKTEEGATDIVSGAEHPALQNWKGETNLSTLFAAGVLG
jgi:predicted ATPase